MSEDATCNVICLKWGTRYPAAYTNTLYRSVKKHLHRPFRFVCVTDDPTDLDEGIDAFVILDGERGFEQKYSQYLRMKNNSER